MARQVGLIKVKGTIGGVSFYKTQDGHLAREKGGVEAGRIASDPAFARTRENGAEFGSSASSGKLLRDAIRPLLMKANDNRVVARLTKAMTDVKNMDTNGARGQRTVGAGVVTAGGKAHLKGFNFNNRAILGAVLFKPYTVVVATGVININGLVPINDIAAPAGATHVTLRGAWAQVDFGGGTYELQLSNAVNLPINAVAGNVVLTPANVPAGIGTDLFLLQIEFFQEVNNVQYSLKNGAYNALAVIEVG